MARVLLAASGGGHLDQLALLTGSASGPEVMLATTDVEHGRARGFDRIASLPDCNLREPLRAARCCLAARALVRRERPEVVISTGAAPGFFCIMWGRIYGARTLWIDSVANAEELSLSGRMASRIAHRCLTQWEHLADGKRVHFAGAVL